MGDGGVGFVVFLVALVAIIGTWRTIALERRVDELERRLGAALERRLGIGEE